MSAETGYHNVRVRENQVEEFIRAYEAGGTLKTKMIRTTNAKCVNEVNNGFYMFTTFRTYAQTV